MNGHMTRRDWLKIGTAATAGLLARPAAAAPALKFSTATIMYQECPLEEALEEIAKTGCEGVDLWEGGTPHNHMQWVEKFRPQYLRAQIESLGLKLFSFSIYWSPADKLTERLEWLAEAGGEVAVVGGGAAAGQPVEAGVQQIMPLVEKARELGIKIAGENHGGSSLSTIASMREFVKLAEPENLGIALAPYHVMAGGESVAEAVEAVGSKLFFFYAWQLAEGMAELPGDGTLDFGPVIGALRRVGYSSYLNIFTHTHVPKDQMTAAVIASRKYLEGLAAGGGAPQ